MIVECETLLDNVDSFGSACHCRRYSDSAPAQLECDHATQPSVLCQLDLSHPATAKCRDDLVVAHSLSHGRLILIIRDGLRLDFEGWSFDKASRLLVSSKQRLDLLPQGLVSGAGFVKKSGAFSRLAFQCGVKQAIELLPLFRLS